jgi:hypothetical protein
MEPYGSHGPDLPSNRGVRVEQRRRNAGDGIVADLVPRRPFFSQPRLWRWLRPLLRRSRSPPPGSTSPPRLRILKRHIGFAAGAGVVRGVGATVIARGVGATVGARGVTVTVGAARWATVGVRPFRWKGALYLTACRSEASRAPQAPLAKVAGPFCWADKNRPARVEGAMRRYENGRGIAARLNLMTVREILEAVGVIFVEENAKARAGAAQGGEMSLTDKFTARGAF